MLKVWPRASRHVPVELHVNRRPLGLKGTLKYIRVPVKSEITVLYHSIDASSGLIL
jgi:hypothetical protein